MRPWRHQQGTERGQHQRSTGSMSNTMLGVAIGPGVGMSIGLALAGADGIPLGLAIGSGIGVAIGSALDRGARRRNGRTGRLPHPIPTRRRAQLYTADRDQVLVADTPGVAETSARARRPDTPNHTPAPISATAVTQENHATPEPRSVPTKASLNAPQSGRRWLDVNPTALPKPSTIAHVAKAVGRRHATSTVTAASAS